MKKLLPLLLLCFWNPGLAADLNGYTAQYECRAGGPNCNVDVATYVTAACAQTITTADSAGTINTKLNTGSSPICVTNGDYTAKGTLSLTASGTAGARRVLRYYRSGDNNDEPWNQSSGNKVKIAGLTITASYWIVHRIQFTNYVNAAAVGNTNLIFNRILIEDIDGDMIHLGDGSNHTLQNSVMRNTVTSGTSDKHCSKAGGYGTNIHLVNNEIYNCQGDGFQTNPGSGSPGTVLENNDIYITSAYYTQGGAAACAENGIDLKAGGTSGNIVKVIHNRIWGHRYTDSSCANGSFGESIIFHESSGASDHNSYGLIQNNIIFDGTVAIATPNREAGGPDHWSIVGNLIYDFRGVAGGTYAIFSDATGPTYSELYLNTAIKTLQGASQGWLLYKKDVNEDIRCNVAIDSGVTGSGGTGTSTQIDYNVYYNTTDAGETNKIVKSIATRANSTAYNANSMMQTGAITGCTTGTQTACFLYKAMTTGTSAGSPPTACTSLGCTYADGTVTWKAVMGPYLFYRQLLTAPNQYAIPRARIDAANVAHGKFCPGVGKTNAMGSRPGIGVNDKVLTLGDAFWDSLQGARP